MARSRGSTKRWTCTCQDVQRRTQRPHAWRPWRRRSRGARAIVTTASIAGYEGPWPTAYAAAKAGVIGLTIAAARDLSATGCSLLTIAPGTMRAVMGDRRPRALEVLRQCAVPQAFGRAF